MKQGRLVRHKVPARIEAKGEFCRWHKAASDAEYREKLDLKLIEEVGEFAQERIFEELADTLEVLGAVILFYEFDRSILPDGYASAQAFTSEEFDDKDLEYELIMEMDDLAEAFVARPTPQGLTELIRRVWEVAGFQGLDHETAEVARLAKRETHGVFEERIILDES
jgi:predicted house-cleaning noncanonical NTP pyrophosphatase (MazG superfamily)